MLLGRVVEQLGTRDQRAIRAERRARMPGPERRHGQVMERTGWLDASRRQRAGALEIGETLPERPEGHLGTSCEHQGGGAPGHGGLGPRRVRGRGAGRRLERGVAARQGIAVLPEPWRSRALPSACLHPDRTAALHWPRARPRHRNEIEPEVIGRRGAPREYGGERAEPGSDPTPHGAAGRPTNGLWSTIFSLSR